MRSFMVSGNVFNVKYVFERIPHELDPFDFGAYARSPLTLVAVSSNLELGEADYASLQDARTQIDYLRASAAVPLISRPVEIDGKKLLDGGICDSIPIGHSLKTGARRQVIVLTQDAGYVKQPNTMMPLLRLAYSKYPLFVRRMAQRHLDYNRVYRQVARMHEEGEVFVIRPSEPVTVSNMEHDPEKLYQLYLSGYKEVQKNWPALQRYLDI
jgi:predicted patatin/cPLA2 family phospholipase